MQTSLVKNLLGLSTPGAMRRRLRWTAQFVLALTLLTLAAPARAQPLVPYTGGATFGSVQVVPVLWTSSVSSAISSQIENSLRTFLDNEEQNAELGEYDISGQAPLDNNAYVFSPVTIQLQTTSSCVANPNFSGQCTYTWQQVAAELAWQMDNNVIPKAGGVNNSTDILYAVFYPPNIAGSIDSGGSLDTGGVHFNAIYNGNGVQYPFFTVTDHSANCPNTFNGLSCYEQLSVTATHELMESMTNPWNGGGWVNNLPQTLPPWLTLFVPTGGGGEIGDLCNGRPTTSWSANTRSTLQKAWSNVRNICISGQAADSVAFSAMGPQPTGYVAQAAWAMDDGGIARSYSKGDGTWTSAAERWGANANCVPDGGNQSACCLDLSGSSFRYCFEGGSPIAAVQAGVSKNVGVTKFFGASGGGIREAGGLGNAPPRWMIAGKSPGLNGGDAGSGYPVTAVDAQLGDGTVWVLWINKLGQIDVVMQSQDDTIRSQDKLTFSPSTPAVPNSRVTALVTQPGKLWVFWTDTLGQIWGMNYDCYFQTSCAKYAGTWSAPTIVQSSANSPVPGATVAAVSPVNGTMSIFWVGLRSSSIGGVWTKSYNWASGWSADSDIYDVSGHPLHLNTYAPLNATISAVSSVPGGVTVFWPDYSTNAIMMGVQPPLGQFQTAQALFSGTSTIAFSTSVTAAANLNAASGQVALFWEGWDPNMANRGTAQTANFAGQAGAQWTQSSIGGVQMVP